MASKCGLWKRELPEIVGDEKEGYLAQTQDSV
jgi:hypothetical protein